MSTLVFATATTTTPAHQSLPPPPPSDATMESMPGLVVFDQAGFFKNNNNNSGSSRSSSNKMNYGRSRRVHHHDRHHRHHRHHHHHHHHLHHQDEVEGGGGEEEEEEEEEQRQQSSQSRRSRPCYNSGDEDGVVPSLTPKLGSVSSSHYSFRHGDNTRDDDDDDDNEEEEEERRRRRKGCLTGKECLQCDTEASSSAQVDVESFAVAPIHVFLPPSNTHHYHHHHHHHRCPRTIGSDLPSRSRTRTRTRMCSGRRGYYAGWNSSSGSASSPLVPEDWTAPSWEALVEDVKGARQALLAQVHKKEDGSGHSAALSHGPLRFGSPCGEPTVLATIKSLLSALQGSLETSAAAASPTLNEAAEAENGTDEVDASSNAEEEEEEEEEEEREEEGEGEAEAGDVVSAGSVAAVTSLSSSSSSSSSSYAALFTASDWEALVSSCPISLSEGEMEDDEAGTDDDDDDDGSDGSDGRADGEKNRTKRKRSTAEDEEEESGGDLEEALEWLTRGGATEALIMSGVAVAMATPMMTTATGVVLTSPPASPTETPTATENAVATTAATFMAATPRLTAPPSKRPRFV